MDALKARKKYDNDQMIAAYEQRQKEEAEKIAKMSPEEKAAYEAEKKERKKLEAIFAEENNNEHT